MNKILVAVSNSSFAELLCAWLEHERYCVERVASSSEAEHMIRHQTYDLLLLDWDLNGVDGPDLCRRFRQRGGNTPVMIVTDRASMSDRVLGFESGADQMVSKPVHFREVSARIRALLRRPPLVETKTISMLGLVLNCEQRCLLRHSKSVYLSSRLFALMKAFFERPDRIMSAEALAISVWCDSKVGVCAIRAAVTKLRAILKQEFNLQPIRTIGGQGYVLESRPVPDAELEPDPVVNTVHCCDARLFQPC
jgi:DNA-binding response OmpR family regulator